MDFYVIRHRSPKKGIVEVYPDFRVMRSKDLMVRSKAFYAVWNEDTGLWSRDEFDVQRVIDRDLEQYRKAIENRGEYDIIKVNYMLDSSSRAWSAFRNYIREMPDTFSFLDRNLTFANDDVRKEDYVTRRLPYSLIPGSIEAWDELISTLYNPEEREKLEWAIGAIVSGDAKDIQKFIVIYGEAGGGKSTILNVIQQLFQGYYTTFEANALTDKQNSFATEMFKDNPLVAIQHDGNLSKILDNSKLNSIVSHEEITINEKFKSEYSARVNAMLFMGTNEPVKITNAKSGLIRRLIDVRTSGRKVPVRRYQTLVSQVGFELGAIASHCLEVYRTLGREYYSDYKPLEMMFETDFFLNFVEENYYIFKDSEYVTLAQAFDMYKAYCEDSKIDSRLPKYKFRVELQNYFEEFHATTRIEGKYTRSVYSKFKTAAFLSKVAPMKMALPLALTLDKTESIFDREYEDQPAQYAAPITPGKKWKDVTTTLKDIDTSKLHYVKVPPNHIVIDFDLKDENGDKSAYLNHEAASKWPKTYAEYSKSQKGIHLHYIYDGDPEQLSRIYAPGIEIKVSVGDSSIRRMLSLCNGLPIAHINSGLPLKGPKVIDADTVKSERGLRELIKRNLRKEIHPGTKPSIDFIHKILEDAYDSGMKYDLTQMRPAVLSFAANSTNQSEYCVKLVAKMKFKSEEPIEEPVILGKEEKPLTFFDVEVFSNLFVICWKHQGPDQKVVRMINPTAQEVSELFEMNLVGFNCRRYDNHILYASYLGYDNASLFEISSKIVSNSANGYFREAYNISYTDVYDFSSKKQSLKAFEIELGIRHQELNIPWDKPVPQEDFDRVAEYCENDVIATEAVFENRKQDFVARQILADLSGLSLNHTTKAHTAKILFGNDPKPQDSFVYTDLSTIFPGYKWEFGKSTYRGEDPGEGGYVYAEPGMYTNVALLDVASMHPASIVNLNLFGQYTAIYKEIMNARLAIKRKDFETAKKQYMIGGVLEKYLKSEDAASDLAYALKIIINIVYGLTSAKFPNPFKDDRNVDNIVAKRGALFMIDLKHALQERGIQVIHIKTDSIKIPNATQDVIDFVMKFGKKYGYTFEHEATYEKFCLVNNAVYVAKKEPGKWTATGAEFIHPYVFKTLFSKEEIVFADLCETKSVTGDSYIYLDMNEGLEEGEHNYQFVGKVSAFVPIRPGFGGGILYRVKDDKYYAVTGTKGFRWLEASLVESLHKEADIDLSYHKELVDAAIKHISEFGDFEWFVSEDQ